MKPHKVCPVCRKKLSDSAKKRWSKSSEIISEDLELKDEYNIIQESE
jgi:uncharacterized protein YbaR (Trm112 family)